VAAARPCDSGRAWIGWAASKARRYCRDATGYRLAMSAPAYGTVIPAAVSPGCACVGATDPVR
jgi:hypothetical protein